MKGFLKKSIICIMVFSMLFSTNASAAIEDAGFSSSSDPNRQAYTPVHCQISISRTSASFQGMSWSSSYGAAYSWEGELRVNPPDGEYTIADAYSSVTGIVGTLPQLADDGNMDADDRAFRCNDMSALRNNQAYYVVITMTTGTKYDEGISLLFESELGIPGVVDSLPIRLQGFTDRVTTGIKTEMGW